MKHLLIAVTLSACSQTSINTVTIPVTDSGIGSDATSMAVDSGRPTVFAITDGTITENTSDISPLVDVYTPDGSPETTIPKDSTVIPDSGSDVADSSGLPLTDALTIDAHDSGPDVDPCPGKHCWFNHEECCE